MTVQQAWEREAEAWIRWARTPEVDHFFWRFGRPALFELIPPPGRLTIDVGAGEGRVSRALRELGHEVVAVEPSPTLAAAAREADPGIEVLEASATAIPLPDDACDLAVASMSLMCMDDLRAAVAEIARVLEPGGQLCFSMVHPGNSLEILPEGVSYFDEQGYSFAEERTRLGVMMTFHDVHRPLQGLSKAFEEAGMVILALREPRPTDEHLRAHPEIEPWRARPCFLLGRVRLEA